MFSGTLTDPGFVSLSLSLRRQAAPGKEKEKSTRASSTGTDREESGVGDLSLELAPEPERAPNPALERDEAEAALLPPAAHLTMVVCCEEDWRQPQSLGHAAGGEDRLGGQVREPSTVQTGCAGTPGESK